MTNTRRWTDGPAWLVALSAALTLGSVGLCFCPTARAGGPPPPPIPALGAHVPTESAHTAMTLESDDDGNELLEHWGDPQYGREERAQIGGIAAALIVAGGIGALRRRARRGASGNG